MKKREFLKIILSAATIIFTSTLSSFAKSHKFKFGKKKYQKKKVKKKENILLMKYTQL